MKICCVEIATRMSNSEGEQQRAEKDEVSQPEAELAKQILHTMKAQKQAVPASASKQSTSKGKPLPISCILNPPLPPLILRV